MAAAAPAAVPPPPRHDTLLVFFDLESSSIGALSSRILQIAAFAVLHSEASHRQHALPAFSHYTRPDYSLDGAQKIQGVVPIAPGARAVHRIQDSTIAAAPPLSRVLRSMARWIHERCAPDAAVHLGEASVNVGAVVFIAHNGFGFDYPLLFAELERAQMHPHELVPAGTHLFFADSAAAWRATQPTWPRGAATVEPGTKKGERALTSLYELVFEEKVESAHNALADVRALARLMVDTCASGRLLSTQPLSVALHGARSLAAQIDKFEERTDRIKTRVARLANEAAYAYAPCYAHPQLAQRIYDTTSRLASIRGAAKPVPAPATSSADAGGGGGGGEPPQKRARVDEAPVVTSPYFRSADALHK